MPVLPATHAFNLQDRTLSTMSSAPKGPFKLVTVNTAPERAKRIVGRVVEALKERYTILHVENVESTSRSYLPPQNQPTH